MVFEFQGKTENYVRLKKDGDGVKFLGSRNLVEYDIQLEKLYVRSKNNISQAVVKIVFRRRMEYHVQSTFFQTILLVVCGWISFYFDIDDFTNRVMVVLTAMLVVATIVSTVQAVSISYRLYEYMYIQREALYPNILPESSHDPLLQADRLLDDVQHGDADGDDAVPHLPQQAGQGRQEEAGE